jgi:hypothetical protein
MRVVLDFLFLFGFYSIEGISVFSSLSLFFSPSSSFFPSGDGDVHRINYAARNKTTHVVLSNMKKRKQEKELDS